MNKNLVRPPEARPRAPVVVTLDWRAYRQRFYDIHGDPVLMGGRLIFEDGWAMSPEESGAPTEWHPPIDPNELLSLKVAYWQRRLSVVKAERDLLRRMVDDLRATQAGRGAPLQQSWVEVDDTGRRVRIVGDVNPDEHEASRLLDCEMEVERCIEVLAGLEAT